MKINHFIELLGMELTRQSDPSSKSRAAFKTPEPRDAWMAFQEIAKLVGNDPMVFKGRAE